MNLEPVLRTNSWLRIFVPVIFFFSSSSAAQDYQPSQPRDNNRVQSVLQELAQISDVSPGEAKRLCLNHVLKLLSNKSQFLSAAELHRLHMAGAQVAHLCGQFDTSLKLVSDGKLEGPEALTLAARDYIGLHQMKQAKIAINGALKKKPLETGELADLFFLRGYVNSQEGQLDQAILDFEHSLQIHPRDDTRHGLVHAMFRKGEFAKGIQQLELIENKTGADLASLYLKAATISKQNNAVSNERKYLQKATELGDKFATTLLVLNTGNQQGIEKLLRMDWLRHDNDVLLAAGMECCKHQWFKLARKFFDCISEDEHSDWLFVLADIEARNGMLDLAERHLKQLLSRATKQYKARILLSDVVMRRGNFDSALEILNPVIPDPVMGEKALVTQARILLTKGDEKRVSPILSQLQTRYPQQHYSIEKLRWGMSRRFLANLDALNKLRKSIVLQFLTDIRAMLKVASDNHRKEWLLKAARCELLLGNGRECLTYANEAGSPGNNDYQIRNLRASALALLQEQQAAEKERDAVLETFRQSGTNPIKMTRQTKENKPI